jgi:hypothetical protein
MPMPEIPLNVSKHHRFKRDQVVSRPRTGFSIQKSTWKICSSNFSNMLIKQDNFHLYISQNNDNDSGIIVIKLTGLYLSHKSKCNIIIKCLHHNVQQKVLNNTFLLLLVIN